MAPTEVCNELVAAGCGPPWCMDHDTPTPVGKAFTMTRPAFLTPAANSAGAQYFFCVTTACANLNSQGTYVVFGTTTSGLDVLQKILALNVTDAAGDSGPSQLVTVKSVTITES